MHKITQLVKERTESRDRTIRPQAPRPRPIEIKPRESISRSERESISHIESKSQSSISETIDQLLSVKPIEPPTKDNIADVSADVAPIPQKKIARVYTDQEIAEKLSEGYILLKEIHWDFLPAGAYIRYIRRGDGPRGARFKLGGFVKEHFINDDGDRMLMIENSPGGGIKVRSNYVAYPIAYKDIEELWKKYDRTTFIEMNLIYNSLAQKDGQIEQLRDRVSTLENIVRGLAVHLRK